MGGVKLAGVVPVHSGRRLGPRAVDSTPGARLPSSISWGIIYSINALSTASPVGFTDARLVIPGIGVVHESDGG